MNYEERRPGEIPTLETRAEAEQSVDKRKRYQQILDIMREYASFGQPALTAKEISIRMFKRGYIPDADRNHVSPRLTEMMKDGRVEPVGKKYCEYTKKKVTCWSLVEEAVPDA